MMHGWLVGGVALVATGVGLWQLAQLPEGDRARVLATACLTAAFLLWGWALR